MCWQDRNVCLIRCKDALPASTPKVATIEPDFESVAAYFCSRQGPWFCDILFDTARNNVRRVAVAKKPCPRNAIYSVNQCYSLSQIGSPRKLLQGFDDDARKGGGAGLHGVAWLQIWQVHQGGMPKGCAAWRWRPATALNAQVSEMLCPPPLVDVGVLPDLTLLVSPQLPPQGRCTGAWVCITTSVLE
jgi:hypothetical protein